MHNGRDIRLKQAGDFSSHDNLPLGGQHLAGHTGKGVVGEAFVQHTVRDDVAQLIRVPFRHRFGGIKLIHFLISPPRKKA